MRQENSQSNSILPKGCGCSLLIFFGLIGAIVVLPSFFLCNANKAKQSEGKQYISSMNKGQQAYYAENTAFSNSVAALGLGLKTETTNYKYSLRSTKQAAFNYGVSKQRTEKSYVSAVFLVPAKQLDPNADRDAMTTTAILCEADSPGTIEPAEPIYQNGKVICGKGTTQVTK
jgi:type IV pilus assembly protein PilA